MTHELGASGMSEDGISGDAGPQALAYLRLEFDVSWRHLGGLEDKRLWLFVGFCVTVGLLGVAAALLQGHSGSPRSEPWALEFVLSIWLMIVSLACRQIAFSERQAAERYRNKINLLRRTLLECLDSQRLHEMQKEGNANALQISSNVPKPLRILDVLDRKRWNTALFMKLTYDAGLAVGAMLAISLVLIR